MSICILYYDGFCEFEVVLSALQFKDSCVTAALENRVYISIENQKFVPDKTIAELNPDEIDLFIIPGGGPECLYDNPQLQRFITELNSKNKYIAGICAGTYLMARYGLLKNKRCTGDSAGLKVDEEYYSLFKDSILMKEDIVVDGNIITAVGQAYVEFAFRLCQIMNTDSDEEIEGALRYFKNIK